MADHNLEPLEQPSSTAALMRWFLVIGVTFALLGYGFYRVASALTKGPAAEASAELAGAAGDATLDLPVPDFRLASLDGQSVGPPDFEGQAVVIDFWASWCGPCKIQAKMLEKLHEEYGGKDVKFLAVNVGEDEETVRDYVARTPFSYSVLLDPEEVLSVRYQIYGLPTVMVIDPKGKVSFLRTGLTDIPTLKKVLANAGITV